MLDREKAQPMERKALNGNQLKVIAMAAMTIDHVTCVLRSEEHTSELQSQR